MKLDVDALRTGLMALASLPNDVPPEQLPGLVAELARAQASVLTAASRAPTVAHREAERTEQDRMLDVEETAEMLGVTPRWLYRHAKNLPFTRKLSRKVLRFSRAAIVRWLATKRL